jgi:hypothetical protein
MAVGKNGTAKMNKKKMKNMKAKAEVQEVHMFWTRIDWKKSAYIFSEKGCGISSESGEKERKRARTSKFRSHSPCFRL